MTATWRAAARYALTVVLGAWAVGALVDLAWSLLAGDLGLWMSLRLADPWSYAFLAAATLVLTLLRRLTAPIPAWRIWLIDGGAYLLVLLLWAGGSAWWYGADVPADDAFALAGFALLDLQLPAAWLLSYWRAPHLDVVLAERPGGTTDGR